jgi:beta-lactamase class D
MNDKNITTAWIVGFVERKEIQKTVVTKKVETNYRPYFFTLNFETPDTSMNTMAVRKEILREILKERQIIK